MKMATPTTSEIFNSAIQTLYELNADERIRQQCQAREEEIRHERTMQKKIADNEKIIAEQEKLLKEKDAYIKLLEEKLDTLTKD